MIVPQEWFLAAGITPDTLMEQLTNVHLTPDSLRTPRNLTYYDSFDGRLFRAGYLLFQEGPPVRTVLSDLHGAPLAESSQEIHPGFLDSLPEEFSFRLAGILQMRTLLPAYHLTAHRQKLALLNNDDKTVCRVVFQVNKGRSDGSTADTELPSSLTLHPVRGYEKQAARLRKALVQFFGEPNALTLFEMLADATDRPAGGRSSYFKSDISEEMNAQEASKRLFGQMLQVIIQNEEGLLRNLDSEFLHDFRVAVRRTRAGLGKLRSALPQALWAHFRTEFSWLGGQTSLLRDLDVYLLHYPVYRSRLSEETRTHLAPFHDYLQRAHIKEHRRLKRQLKGARFRRLKQQWQEFLNDPGYLEAPEGQEPVVPWSCRLLRNGFQKIYKSGSRIEETSPPEALHELRINFKKLRYLVEFFSPLFPPKQMKKLIQAMKQLQDTLGSYQDYCVQVDSLTEFGHQMVQEGMKTPETLMAMGVLVEDLKQRQVETRREFQARFDQFSARETKDLIADLFSVKDSH